MEVMEDMEAIGKLLSEKELFFGSLSAESGGLCMYLERSVMKVKHRRIVHSMNVTLSRFFRCWSLVISSAL
jgi:hypothetical protein